MWTEGNLMSHFCLLLFLALSRFLLFFFFEYLEVLVLVIAFHCEISQGMRPSAVWWAIVEGWRISMSWVKFLD